MPGVGSTLGWMEWRDVDVALEYALLHGARSFVLVGWSMGGTIANLLLKHSRFAENIVGLVLVAPVTSWRAVVANAVRAARLPAVTTAGVEFLLGNRLLCHLAGLRDPVHLADLEAEADHRDRPVATLVVHNPDDELVPHELLTEFVALNGTSADLLTFEPSPHAMEWNVDPDRFERELGSWVSRRVLSAER